MILINDIFLIGFFILVVGCIVAFILKATNFQIAFWSFVYVYIVAVLGLTLCPIPFQEVEFMTPIPNNLIPFKSIAAELSMGITKTSITQIGGNILLSVPYGFFILIATRKKRIFTYLLFPLLFPLVIECLQLVVGLIIGVNYRSFDVDDFILNLIGVYFGFLIGKIVPKYLLNKIYNKLYPQK